MVRLYCPSSNFRTQKPDTSLSESDQEAEKSRETLQNLVTELPENNQEISRRLRNLEDMCESQSVLTNCFRNTNNVEITEDDAETIRYNLVLNDSDETPKTLPGVAFQYSFEIDLNTSRVYKRTKLYEPDASFTSSAVRTHAWSIFSGLSLSEVSIISVIALPLYSHDISNSQWYICGEYDRFSSQSETLPVYKLVVLGHEDAGKTALTMQVSSIVLVLVVYEY
jgi:hypothetical protein